jgi:tryptophan synthase alpha chain
MGRAEPENAACSPYPFIPFITGGDPDMETTEKLLFALAGAGADLIEIGIPFSDPIAEGPVIQAADERALASGTTVDKIFDMVKRVRSQIRAPLLFMTYYNPVFSYGNERFLARCAECGMDGLIVPDLPFEEKEELAAPCKDAGLTLISLIAPTSDERIKAIAKEAEGFLYCVSSLGVTGMRSEIGSYAEQMIRKARSVSDIPCAVGFGVSVPRQAKAVAAYADGVIVGSAVVSVVARHGRESEEPVRRFAEELRKAIDEA